MSNTLASALGSIWFGNTPPKTPGGYTGWLSSAPEDLICPPPQFRKAIIANDGAIDSAMCQEPSVWWYNGKWHMYYAGSAGLKYASNPSPDPTQGSWATHSAYVLGNGVASYNGAPTHQSIYVEGGYVYITFGDSLTNTQFLMAKASLDSPTSVSLISGWSFSITPWYNASGIGNTFLMKDDDGTYKLFMEFGTSIGWTGAWAQSSTLTGTYTMQVFPMAMNVSVNKELFPKLGPAFQSLGGSAWVAKSNGKYIFYGGSSAGAIGACYIYRAVSDDLINWTITNNNQPFIRPGTIYEVDQVVDPFLVQGPNGQWWGFWAGMDNITSVGYVMCSPLMPALKIFNGQSWVASSLGQDQYTELWNTQAVSSDNYALKHMDHVNINTTSASLTVVLPRAAAGARCRVTNHATSASSTNTLTVAVGNAADYLLASSSVALGTTATYECLIAHYWTRRG
jgi:hypothetical protein